MNQTRRDRIPGLIDDQAVSPPLPNTKCCVFDGVNEWVSMGDVADFEFERTDTFSFSLWVKSTASARSYALVAKNGWNYTVTSGYYLRFNVGGEVEIFLVASNTTMIRVIQSTTGVLNDGSWHHVVMTYDGSSSAAGVKVYIDGVDTSLSVTQDNISSGSFLNNKAFSLGALAGEDFWLDGKIEEASVWNKVLTQADVDNIYNSGKPNDLLGHPSQANLLSWWRMGDGDTFPTLTDNKGSNDGTLTNMEAGDIVTDAP